MTEKSPEKRTAIMEAALDLFTERGFHGAPTSLIAERAGVGVGTIYRYFENKEELIRSIYEELHLRYHERFTISFEDGVPLQERLTLVLVQLLAIFIESPREFKFLELYHYSPYADHDRPDIPTEEHNAVRRLLSEGRKTGVFKDAPLPVLQAIFLGPIVYIAKEHIAGRLNADKTVIEVTKKACWEALLKQ